MNFCRNYDWHVRFRGFYRLIAFIPLCTENISGVKIWFCGFWIISFWFFCMQFFNLFSGARTSSRWRSLFRTNQDVIRLSTLIVEFSISSFVTKSLKLKPRSNNGLLYKTVWFWNLRNVIHHPSEIKPFILFSRFYQNTHGPNSTLNRFSISFYLLLGDRDDKFKFLSFLLFIH